MSSTWSVSSSSSSISNNHEDENYNLDKEGENSLLLIVLMAGHFALFILVYFWLHPTDEPPRNAIMFPLGTNIKRSRRTGEPISPTTRLSLREISYLSRREPCHERKYQLTEEDQKTLIVVSEGEVNYLRQLSDLPTDPAMNYGSLIVKRGVPMPEEVKQDTKEQIENFDDVAGVVEDLYKLRREKKVPEKAKNKKKKTKERQDALDQLTRGEPAKPLLSRIIPIVPDRHVQSRKLQRTVSRILQPERTQDPQPTLEEDKTQERVVKAKKASSRPTQKPSAHEINVKKKKSGTLKEKKQLTPREELSLARTMEETTRKQPNTASTLEPPPP